MKEDEKKAKAVEAATARGKIWGVVITPISSEDAVPAATRMKLTHAPTVSVSLHPPGPFVLRHATSGQRAGPA